MPNKPLSPKLSEAQRAHHLSDPFKELLSISKIALPMILTSLLLYCRFMISMLFLGRLGELALAGGSLAIGFANITVYSILSGLAVGMEPICGQAFGAKKFTLLGLCLQRTILLLLFTSIPISLLWLYMKQILLLCGQDEAIATHAQSYLLYSIPDLLAQSLLHPLRIYLRSQSITLPLTLCSALSILLHIPINFFLVSYLGLGIKGVALSGIWTNFNLVVSLIMFVAFSCTQKKTWCGFSFECFTQWKSLIKLAIPSCVSVCLEWWWYEIMILLCGLLANPTATVGSMGILIQTTSLLYIFPSSISFSVSTRVSNNLCDQNPLKAKLSAIVGLSCSFILGISALLFSLSVRNVWASMFTKDREIISLTAMVFPIIGLCELGNCPQTTGCGVLRGSARPKVGANINLGGFYLVGMPLAIWLAFFAGFGFEGLWLGLLAAQGSCAVTMLVVLSRTDWDYEAERAQKLTETREAEDETETSRFVSQPSFKMPTEAIQKKTHELVPDNNYSDSVYNRIIVGWAVVVFSLGLVTFSFPCQDVHGYYSNKAFITYIGMLISELGIWIPLWIYIPPPKGDLKKTKLFLHASFVFFNHVSSIFEQIIPSIHHLNHERWLIYVNLFSEVVSFFIISALFWLTIDLKMDGFSWEHFSLGCNAALSASLLNISVFQLTVKKSFLHFPVFSIMRDVIDLIDLIIRIVGNKEEHS